MDSGQAWLLVGVAATLIVAVLVTGAVAVTDAAATTGAAAATFAAAVAATIVCGAGGGTLVLNKSLSKNPICKPYATYRPILLSNYR